MFLHVLNALSCALVTLLANCYVDTLLYTDGRGKVQHKFYFLLSITIFSYLKIRGKLKLRFRALTLTSPNTLDVLLQSFHNH